MSSNKNAFKIWNAKKLIDWSYNQWSNNLIKYEAPIYCKTK